MKAFIFVIVAAAALSVAYVIPTAQQPAGLPGDWAPMLESLPSPAGSSTAEPQFSTEGAQTVLSWLELAGPRTTFKFAERTAAGWSAPRTVAAGDDFMVNSADVPSVRFLADGTLVAEWLRKDGPDPESYTIRLSWSKDGGTTWSAPVSPHHDTVQTEHGFASLFQVPGASLGLVWLDGRAINPDAPEGAGNMALRATVFGATGKQGPEVVVDRRVCECCPTAAAATADGIVVAYRDRSANEIRDIYVTRLVSGRWSLPTRVHADNWRVEGCPVNGPAISARGRDVVVSWFTAAGGHGRAFAAFSQDGGRTFGPPVRVDEVGSEGRVGVALLTDGSAAVSWIEFANEHSTLMVRRVARGGLRGPAVRVAEAGGTRIPRLVRSGSELLFAWTETADDASRVRTARATVPRD